MTTIKDIAKELNLSAATVSRALNDFPEVKQKTKQRVKETALRLNYRPNRSAQTLHSGQAGVIGIILKHSQTDVPDPHMYEIMVGLSQHLDAVNLELMFRVALSKDEVEPYKNLYERGTVDGFILNSPTKDDVRIAYLQERNIPFVVHGKDHANANYSYFDIDNFQAGYDATRLLLDIGHTKIAYLMGDERMFYVTERLRGTYKAFADYELKTKSISVHHGVPTDRFGLEAATQLLNHSTPPTAIVCSSTVIAAGVMRALRRLNLSCPEHVALVSHDDAVPTLKAIDFVPSLTVTRAPLREACKPLSEMMVSMLNNDPKSDPIQIISPAELIVRGSTIPLSRMTPIAT